MRTSTFSRFLVKYVILKLCSDILCCHICSQQPWRRERSSRKSANLPHRVLPPAHSYGAAVNVSIQTEVSLSLSPFIASAGAAHHIEELNRSSVAGVIARSSVARPFGQQEECNLIADILLWYLSFDMLSRGLGHVSLPHRAETAVLATLCPTVRPAPCFIAVVWSQGNISFSQQKKCFGDDALFWCIINFYSAFFSASRS